MNKRIIALLVVLIALTSCSRDRSKPNIMYMPDMYKSIPYEPYGINTVMKDSMAALLPPQGSVARGHATFDLPGTFEGYNQAKAELKSPLEVNKENLANGKKMYNIYCASCHGVKGDGKGTLVQNGKFLGVPNYKDRDINEGSIYHVIYYGRNMMGPHAMLLTEKERWQVVQYVEKLRNKLKPKE
ncbi:MAG: cytochrome C [Flavobacteriia bacterium]|nr:MAG: cytochrome C [Flavobacteriia bacterium]